MERAVFYSGGTEAIDCSLKLARQYHIERKQPQRVNFIGRYRSYHGNSLSALALGHHPSRRAPYEDILPKNFHHVSPAYSYRYQREDESTEEYVARLAQELEDTIQELGPDTVAAFYVEPGIERSCDFLCELSTEGNHIHSRWSYYRVRPCS
jgi:adenosylmethionine-8-amino-7-oxononanoate aminotransferase